MTTSKVYQFAQCDEKRFPCQGFKASARPSFGALVVFESYSAEKVINDFRLHSR